MNNESQVPTGDPAERVLGSATNGEASQASREDAALMRTMGISMSDNAAPTGNPLAVVPSTRGLAHYTPSAKCRITYFLRAWPDLVAELKADGVDTSNPHFKIVAESLTILVDKLLP